MEFKDLNQLDYISVQQESGGLDEIQRLFLSYISGCHVALSGPPGVGKTVLVNEFGEKVNQKLISRVMGPKVNESLLISYPDLINSKGTSVTVTRPGLLARALKDDCIYFADEIDRLTEDNQKLHNSAFDNRRSVTMRDGTVIQGKENFFGIIAYNPSEGMKSDLESALADRFVHINFDYFPPEVQSMISLKKAGFSVKNLLPGKVSWRAIYYHRERKHLQFFEVETVKKDLLLRDTHRNKTMEISKLNAKDIQTRLFIYLRYRNGPVLSNYTQPVAYKLEDLSLKLAEFGDELRKLSTDGVHYANRKLVSDMGGTGESIDFSCIRLHIPSSRIQQAALKQYAFLTAKIGCSPYLAQQYAVNLMIDQAAFGKYGKAKLGQGNSRDLFVAMAGTKGLLPMRKQRKLCA
ncbi:MoxR family ATPase [bacterium]|nr:MoxR family ATPase [bacterium]